MNILISESKLNNVIFKYLDEREYELKKFMSGNIELQEKSSGKSLIIYFEDEYGCYIKQRLVEDVSSFFSINNHASMTIIAEWFRKLTGVKINSVYNVV